MDSLWNGHASPQSIPWYASSGVAPTARMVPSPVAFRRDSGPTNTSVPGGASTASPSTSKVTFPSSTMYSSSLARPGLVVLIYQCAVLAGREGVDSERVNPEVLAHGNISAAPLDVVEVRDLPMRRVTHPITSVCARRCEWSIVTAIEHVLRRGDTNLRRRDVRSPQARISCIYSSRGCGSSIKDHSEVWSSGHRSNGHGGCHVGIHSARRKRSQHPARRRMRDDSGQGCRRHADDSHPTDPDRMGTRRNQSSISLSLVVQQPPRRMPSRVHRTIHPNGSEHESRLDVPIPRQQVFRDRNDQAARLREARHRGISVSVHDERRSFEAASRPSRLGQMAAAAKRPKQLAAPPRLR